MWTATIFVLALMSVSFVQADLYCGYLNRCTDDLAFCCGNNNELCCTPSVSAISVGVVRLLWICGAIIIAIKSCCIWICIRRRWRASAGHINVNQQPTYGSTSVTTAYSKPPSTYSSVTASVPAYTPA